MGACLELMQSFFLIEDDIMDNGVKRRGKTCWHRLVSVFEALNFFINNIGGVVVCGVDLTLSPA